MATPKTVAFQTLGCKLNFSESSTIRRSFEANGYTSVDIESGPDIYVLNTCSVTDFADRKCRKAIRHALRINAETFVVVMGCYAQLKPNEIAEIEGVDLVLGAAEKFSALQYIDGLSKSPGKGLIKASEVQSIQIFESGFSFGDRTRSFLKVQDGCDYNCSFCTIPYARGKSRSDSVKNIVIQAQKIADLGIKEIVLTGVNIGDFGKMQPIKNPVRKSTKSFQKVENFLKLIVALDDVEGIERFRISSIEPNLCSAEIISFVSESKKFVPHFHMPLQSGSERILKRMRRRYPRSLYADKVSMIKNKMPFSCIGVDVIVGFPGEKEVDFLDTYQFLNELDISYLHVFTYSERNGTDATKLHGRVPMELRRKRNQMLRILSEKKKSEFYRKHLKSQRSGLFESIDKNGKMTGFTDNYIKIVSKADPFSLNQVKEVFLSNINGSGVVEAHLCETPSLV